MLSAPGLPGCGAPTPRAGDAGPILDGAPALDATDAGATDADASAVDAGTGTLDAGMSDAGMPGPPTSGPLLYPFDRAHSPLPLDVADALRDLAARGPSQREDVFAKVGDSITATPTFLQCFAGTRVDLGGRGALQATIDHFRAGDAAGTTPFERTSVAAVSGWSASAALAGSPSPLTQELNAVHPRFASLMFGTNDAGFVDLDSYGRNMTALVDGMLAVGTLPVLSSIPPRDDSSTADARVPVFNAVVRALAQSRGLPFVDFHRALLPLARHGLASDGVHPQTSTLGACNLTPAGLTMGGNVRNLLVLEALDRLRRTVVLGEDALDAEAPRLRGTGTNADPFAVPSLPFAGHADTRVEGERAVARWDACSMADEGGPEVRFRFHLDAPTRITAAVSSGRGADLDIHLLPARGGPADCLVRDNRQVARDLPAGDWDVVVDTFVGRGGALPGELFVAILPG